MDERSFEELTKQVARADSRRSMVKVLTGSLTASALAFAAGGRVATAAFGFCRAPGTPCSKGQEVLLRHVPEWGLRLHQEWRALHQPGGDRLLRPALPQGQVRVGVVCRMPGVGWKGGACVARRGEEVVHEDNHARRGRFARRAQPGLLGGGASLR